MSAASAAALDAFKNRSQDKLEIVIKHHNEFMTHLEKDWTPAGPK